MKASAPVVSQTQHPFGDPSATQYANRDQLMRELQQRETRERMEPPQLGPVSGTIEIRRPARHGWTIVAIVLFVAAMATCLAVATTG